MRKNAFLLTLALFSVLPMAFSQQASPQFMPKGQFYFYWGYNRSMYSESDITFKSPQANFTLYDVLATDVQSKLSFHDYFIHPTIPQFNVRVGYAVRSNLSVSFGYDHMKYRVTNGQSVRIKGQIASSNETGVYAGTYNNSQIVLTPDFLRYEHTNGLNYFSADADYFWRMWKSQSGMFELAVTSGLSLGILYPRSDIDVFNVEGVNVFHVAGWGTAASAGVRIKMGKHFFAHWGNRGGFIHLPNVLCRLNDFTAVQQFWFAETAMMVGYNFSFSKKTEKK